MTTLRTLALTLPLVLPLSAALVTPDPAAIAKTDPAQAAAPALLPDPTDPVTIDPEQSGALGSALRALAASAGVNVFVSPEAVGALASGAEHLQAAVQVPPDQAWSFVGTLLLENQLSMILHRSTAPRLISIHSIEQSAPRRNSIRSLAYRLQRDQLDELSKHPALLATLVLETPNIDARSLVNSLRGLMTDNATQSMLPGGESNSILIASPGAELVRVAQIVEGMDAAAGRQAELRRAADSSETPTGE